MVANLRTYWKEYISRNRDLNHEDSNHRDMMKVQDSAHLCESVEELKVQMTNIDKKFNDFKADIIETFTNDGSMIS